VLLLTLIETQNAQIEGDLHLLMRVKDRDEAALGELYDKYSSVVYSLMMRMVRETGEAQDLLQEIFIQVWTKAPLFSASKGSVYTWIMTIARRKAIDRLRSRTTTGNTTSLSDDAALAIPDPAYHGNPLHVAISEEYDGLMRNGLATLSAEQRTVIEMSYYDGYTQEQIAEKLSVPLGTVKTRMRQGLIKLRNYMKERIE
jgi:RNA polymerase sigma-70 factor (ECF subfamily)